MMLNVSVELTNVTVPMLYSDAVETLGVYCLSTRQASKIAYDSLFSRFSRWILLRYKLSSLKTLDFDAPRVSRILGQKILYAASPSTAA